MTRRTILARLLIVVGHFGLRGHFGSQIDKRLLVDEEDFLVKIRGLLFSMRKWCTTTGSTQSHVQYEDIFIDWQQICHAASNIN